jgi:membrane protein
MLFPYTQYVAALKTFLISRVEEIVTYRDLAGYGGALGLLLAASGLFSSMRTILNRIFQVNKGKHLVVGKLRDFGMVLLVLLFFLISTTILPLLEFMRDSAHKIAWLQAIKFDPPLQSLFPILFFVIVYALFYILYYFVPYEKLGVVPAAVSALFATVFWEIAKRVFGYYLTHAATLDQVYGAYIFTVAIVLWIYYSSLVFILGAEIGQLYRERMPEAENKMAIGIDAMDL